MSQSVSELSRRLENALDTSYNITDLPTVVEIIGVLESTRITIEQLESTQLTKCINHMRRRTADETLARRSKNLIKRWRSMLPQVVPPSPNGKTAKWRRNGESRKRRRDASASPVASVETEQPASTMTTTTTTTTTTLSSPKRRGRKRGSRGVDALMGDVVETSPYLEFKHKVASGPKKVKTTKELLEDLQNRKLNSSSSVTTSPIVQVKPQSPLSMLHSDGSQSHEASVEVMTVDPEPVVIRVTDIEEEICELRRQLALVATVQVARGVAGDHEDEDDEEPQCTCTFTEIHETDDDEMENGGVTKKKRPRSPPPLLGDGLNAAVTDGEASIGGRRPPVRSIFDLDETDDQARIEIEESEVTEGRPVQWRCVEDPACPVAYRECSDVTSEDVRALHSLPLDNVNGNWCPEAPPEVPPEEPPEGGLWERVVPQFGRDVIPKCHEEGVRWRRKRRRSSQGEEVEEGVFREWFQTLHVKSYNDELLTILPYVVID
uniref:Mediator of RNA polymerase II transcription subunit 26 n=1 Tax=Phlebotomus kandelakii TaxID=1109342 RepID=A0A6B2EEF6_9DIPT